MLLRWIGRTGAWQVAKLAGAASFALGLSACSGGERAPFVDGARHLPGEGGDSSGGDGSATQPSDMSMTGGGTGSGAAPNTPSGSVDAREVYLIGFLNNGASEPPLGYAPIADTSTYALTVPSPDFPYAVDHSLLYMDAKMWLMADDYVGSDPPADVALPKSSQANDHRYKYQCPSPRTLLGGIVGPEGQAVYQCTDDVIYENNAPLPTIGGFDFLALGHDDLALGLYNGILAVSHAKTGMTRSIDGNPTVLPFAARATEKGFWIAWQADVLELIEVDDMGTKTLVKQYPAPADDIEVSGAGAKIDSKGNLFCRAFPKNNADQVLVYKFPIDDEEPSIVYDNQAEGQTLLLNKEASETPFFTGP
ncbi:MAG TPA: hypothetical protein VHB79_21440 [Polyangiaceae bacterium]|nr:hypothetical protein [Polyangiaceae bacterium]